MSFDSVMALARFVSLAVNITTMFLCMRPKRRMAYTLAVLTGFAALIGGITLLAGLYGFILNISGLLFLPVVLWLFQGQTFQKVFAFFMQYQFSALMISLADALTALTIGYKSLYAPTVMLALVILLIGSYLTAVLRFGRRLFERLFVDGRRGEWMAYSFGAAASFMFVMAVRWANIGPWLYTGIVLFVLWSFGLLCFAIINTHEKTRHKIEAEFAASIISSGREHYQRIMELNDKIRILRHDMKYHLNVLGELLAEDNREEIERYLSEANERLSLAEAKTYCGNSVINALLLSYDERCGKLGIRFDVKADLPDTLPIPNYEQCIVLGNLLENAVEACAFLEDKRFIELIIKPLGRQLVIKVSNSHNGEWYSENEGALPPSTKKDGGLGLRSVLAVAKKNNGELMISSSAGVFEVLVTVGL